MKIDFAKLQYQYQLYKTEIDEAIHTVLDKSASYGTADMQCS